MSNDYPRRFRTAIPASWSNRDEAQPLKGWAVVETGSFRKGDRILQGEPEFNDGTMAWFAVEDVGIYLGAAIDPGVRVIRRTKPLSEATEDLLGVVAYLLKVDRIDPSTDEGEQLLVAQCLLADHLAASPKGDEQAQESDE